jgi:hypothetical protein
MRRAAAYDHTGIWRRRARAPASTRASSTAVLAIEPGMSCSRELAPLLANAGEHFDAWVS